jgi:hypothetical protein
MSLHDKTKT